VEVPVSMGDTPRPPAPPAEDTATDAAPLPDAAAQAERDDLPETLASTEIATSHTPWLAVGVLVLAMIVAVVAALQIRARPGRHRGKETPIVVPASGGTTSRGPAADTSAGPAAPGLAPPTSATVATTGGEGVAASAEAPSVSATVAPKPTSGPSSKAPPGFRPRIPGRGDDPYADVPTWGGRRPGGGL
jgi:hypothetical protein